MENILFPHAFLDLPEVSDLPAEHKLVLCMLAAHHRVSPCGVLVATSYVVAQIPLVQDVFWGVATDLDRRKIIVCDCATAELFVLTAFDWHRAPAADEDSTWARQVWSAVGRVRSARVGDAVRAAIARPPTARLPSLKLPSNLLTAMPLRGRGQAWTASETLAHFALAVNPDQTAAGVFSPRLPAIAAFCSLPQQTLAECVDSLAAAHLVTFDETTGEFFSAARLRAASERDIGRIVVAGENIRSWAVFRAMAEAAKRRFPKIQLKSKCCPLGEGRESEPKIGKWDASKAEAGATLFRIRFGPHRVVS